ncbi:hypothetical protein I4U23_015742 [Adineta vaga]|nr:hypothetical protein I4U23_015742 [Adineta vaga]
MTGSGERFTDIDVTNKRLPACYGYITWNLLPIEQTVTGLTEWLPEIMRFIKLAKKHCMFPNEHQLNKDEAAAIYLYTMELSEDECIYRTLNQTLRLDDRSKIRPWFPYLRLLDSAVSKLPNVEDVVWRGVDKDVSEAFKKGQKITWWSISSCSTSIDVISIFLGNASQSTLFSIKCLNGKCIAAYTCFPNENEVILMPGTKFEVVADPLHHHGGLHIVHLREIDEIENNLEQKEFIESADPQPLAAASVAKQLNKLNSDYKVFANPCIRKKIHCKGRPCSICHKCCDWHFSGDSSVWNWICNYENWSEADKDLWYGGRYKLFTKCDAATCDLLVRFGRLLAGLGRDLDGRYARRGAAYVLARHVCLCEMH